MVDTHAGDIPAATKEDVDLAVDAAKRAISRNKGRDWCTASGSVRAGYLRAIAAKVLISCWIEGTNKLYSIFKCKTNLWFV